jgi:hypothetical protein
MTVLRYLGHPVGHNDPDMMIPILRRATVDLLMLQAAPQRSKVWQLALIAGVRFVDKERM